MDIISFIKTLGYFGTWGVIFSECAFLIGIFLPGDSLLFPVGILAGQGEFNLWIMIPGCFIAALTGNLVGYEIGKRMGMPFLRKHFSKYIHEDHLDKVHSYFEKYGPITVLITRFIHFIRTLTPFIAGATQMNYRLFVMYSALGALLWAAGLPLLGYTIGNMIPPGTIDRYILPALGLLVVVVAGPKLWSYYRKKCQR